ncbi:MAG: rod shape-determining protein RodA [Verrucomicrobia bacterium]|jgi:rod shape determining protein RodA|nr:rod shape-determining protein RodA [Verrucomicrobiota bacterium]
MLSLTLNGGQGRLDRLQIAAVVGLMFLGAAFVFSATMVNESLTSLPLLKQSWMRQIIWYALGMGAAAALCVVDYHTLARWCYVTYWTSILTLVVVLVPGIGTTHGWGAMRWIDLGPFQFQPSEFAKLAFILTAAHYLSRPPDELRQPAIFWKGVGMFLLPFALIFKEPDLGSALVLLPTGLAMMLVAGTPRKYLLRLAGVVGLLAALFLVDVLFAPPGWQISLQPYQRNRLLVYFGRDYTHFALPGATPAELQRLRRQQFNDSHNVRQALISVGSGGLTGKGWRQGTQNALGYLPRSVAHNDFIFSVLAEESGFVGSVVVLTLYAVVLFTGLRMAGQARDRLGKLLAVGVVTLVFSHVFINIGMNIRIMPVTGVPLPLLSYGGSSVLGSLIAMGILQNVHLHRKGY